MAEVCYENETSHEDAPPASEAPAPATSEPGSQTQQPPATTQAGPGAYQHIDGNAGASTSYYEGYNDGRAGRAAFSTQKCYTAEGEASYRAGYAEGRKEFQEGVDRHPQAGVDDGSHPPLEPEGEHGHGGHHDQHGNFEEEWERMREDGEQWLPPEVPEMVD